MAGMVGVIALALVLTQPARGQDEPVDEPQGAVDVELGDTQVAEPEDADDTEAEVQRIVTALVVLAALTGVGLVGFVVHTSPRRRARQARAQVSERPPSARRTRSQRPDRPRADGADSRPTVAAPPLRDRSAPTPSAPSRVARRAARPDTGGAVGSRPPVVDRPAPAGSADAVRSSPWPKDSTSKR
jgi:hypothetical protein